MNEDWPVNEVLRVYWFYPVHCGPRADGSPGRSQRPAGRSSGNPSIANASGARADDDLEAPRTASRAIVKNF